MILMILFWIVVAVDAAALLVIALLALAAAGPSHTNPLAALVVPVALPGLVLAGAVVLFQRAPSAGWKVAALAIAAFPILFTLGARGAAQRVAQLHQDGRGGFSQFRAGPQREMEAAIARNDLEAVARLLPATDLDRPGISGATLLVLALRRLRETPDQLDVVRALLKAGADPNIGRDELPLQVAIGASRTAGPEPVRMLLEAGANPNARGTSGEPVYFVAGGAGIPPEIMSLLLEHGADIQAAGRDGRTVLSLPVTIRNWSTTLLLLQRGAPRQETRTPDGLPFRAYVESQAGQGTGDGLSEVVAFLRAADTAGSHRQ